MRFAGQKRFAEGKILRTCPGNFLYKHDTDKTRVRWAETLSITDLIFTYCTLICIQKTSLKIPYSGIVIMQCSIQEYVVSIETTMKSERKANSKLT